MQHFSCLILDKMPEIWYSVCKYERQYRTELVVQMRSQIFRQIV